MPPFLIPLLVLAVVVVAALLMSVKVIQQQQVGIVQRLGKFHKTIEPGLHLIVPFVDQVSYTLDMREAVVPFPPQGVITEDNLMVGIDSVIYFQIIDPVRAAYDSSGNPTSAASCATRISERHASSAGLTTHTLPAARAPPTLRPKICMG